ncbi:MAG: hypothetical protein QOE55_5742 [Acidobacteriaceae bacterium]|jgi:hypothetical protein|nr:hypothetical protein [Acidobacteriaceae bacterium]
MVSTVRWSCIGRVTSKLDFSPLPCKPPQSTLNATNLPRRILTEGLNSWGINPKFPLQGILSGRHREGLRRDYRAESFAVNLRTRTGCELGPPPGKGGQSFLRSSTLQGGCTLGRWSSMTLDRLLPFSLALVLLTGCGSGVHRLLHPLSPIPFVPGTSKR